MVGINYKGLIFFQKSHEFTLHIYKICKNFPHEEKYGVISQLQRASSSIGANISEGSVKGEVEFRKFLKISLGSAKECEYFILLAKDLDYISIDVYTKLQLDLNLIIGSMNKYIDKITKN